MTTASSNDQPTALAAVLGRLLQERGLRLATAESCTGGMIAAAVTAIAGSSEWFERGFITYSNEAKVECLRVAAGLIASHGAVSEPVARAMADGARHVSQAALGVSVTGIAGPGGGSDEKPVGTVCFGWSSKLGARTETQRFSGDREAVRLQATQHALQGLIRLARTLPVVNP